MHETPGARRQWSSARWKIIPNTEVYTPYKYQSNMRTNSFLVMASLKKDYLYSIGASY